MQKTLHLSLGIPKIRWAFIFALITLAACTFFFPGQLAASPLAAAEPVHITLPPFATVEISVGGFCQNRGIPFPGPSLEPIGVAPTEVQAAISYGLSENLLTSNVYQVQLAVWGVLGQGKATDSRFSLVGEVMDYATAESATMGATDTSLYDAAQAGTIAVELDDFESVSSPAYYGIGTVRLTNLTGEMQEVVMPYGVLFRDKNSDDNQNMGVFPLAEVVVVTEIQVQQPGPQGEAGPQGVAGPQGPAGEQGTQGPAGPPGEAGPQGVAGEQGAQGPVGPAGAVGPQGGQGPEGPRGATGAAGPVGPQGIAGIACWDMNGNNTPDDDEDINGDNDFNTLDCMGPVGPQGVVGPTGAQGAAGPQGSSGPMGATGATGLACWDLNGNGSADSDEDINGDDLFNALDCAGADGPQGAAGPQGVAGPMGPTGADGATGPQGPAGVDGAQGAAGPQGPSGPMGATGTTGLACWDLNGNGSADDDEDINGDDAFDALDCAGADGATGPMGPAGVDGADGATGPMGPSGPTGAMGPAGADGADGATGPMGPQGPAGAMGPAGADGADGATGPMGPQGPAGPPGLFDVITVMDMTAMTTEPSKEMTVMCEDGLYALGGGFDIDGPASDDWIIAVQESYPVDGKGWHVRAEAWNARISRQADCGCDEGAWKITAWVVCGEQTPRGRG